jgi:hypothetical protein
MAAVLPSAEVKQRARSPFVPSVLLAGALVLGACGSAPQTFVDGIPIGEPTPADPRFEATALETLDAERPGHPRVTATESYSPDWRTPDGGKRLIMRSSGSDRIVVLRLGDGGVRAYWIFCHSGGNDFCGVGNRLGPDAPA